MGGAFKLQYSFGLCFELNNFLAKHVFIKKTSL